MNNQVFKKSIVSAIGILVLGLSITNTAIAQNKPTGNSNNLLPFNSLDLTKNKTQSAYSFNPTATLACLPVEDQCKTSTCWSYSTLSMLESELIRLGKGQHNLSQMYVARWAYVEKAIIYLRMNGKHNFEQGGEGHDIPSIIKKYGIVPEEVYTGLKNGSTRHDHAEMIAVLKGYMEALVKRDPGTYSTDWIKGLEGILDAYLGPVPSTFTYQGKTYTPNSYATFLGLNMDDYVALTSFTHHQPYEHFAIEVQDNWAMDRAWNLPLDEFTQTVKDALNKGYTIAWAADVSEKGFSFRDGLALVPEDESTIQKIGKDNAGFNDAGAEKKSNAFAEPVKEKLITPELRQEAFDKQTTTDDHGMHIVGMSLGSDNKTYFLVKNSWGTGNYLGGLFYVSESYFRYKTISIMVHNDALPKSLVKKIN
jgi:bleomycin hydrolase